MKKIFFIFIFLVTYCIESNSQTNSYNGLYLCPKDTVRVFFVFAETLNDPNDPGALGTWLPNNLPSFKDSLFDHSFIQEDSIKGFVTKYFYEASFGKYIVLGDYYPNLVQINYSDLDVYENGNGAIPISNYLNDILGNDIITNSNFSLNNDFDNWTSQGQYYLKENKKDSLIDVLIVIWRNNPIIHPDRSGGFGVGPYSYSIKGMKGISNYLSICINEVGKTVEHEFSHLLLGGNGYHSGGAGAGKGNFLSDFGGYSMLSSWNANLFSYNGWDRDWLGWKPDANQYYISTRTTNYLEANGDLVYGQELQSNEFILRDFSTYGDAIRIKLPYLKSINSLTKNQYIWMENHQLIENHIEYDSSKEKGIRLNLQVGNDDSTYPSGCNTTNYITPICSFGNYDFSYNYIDNTGNQFEITTSKDSSNSLSGYSLLQLHAINYIEPNQFYGSLYYNDIFCKEFLLPKKIVFNDTLLPLDYPIYNGGQIDIFPIGSKLNISTNPSPVTMLTYTTAFRIINNSSMPFTPEDNRNIFLNGLQIEILQQYTNGDIKVRIRWDKFDVENDVRWCGPIVLNEKINLKEGKTILLDQGRTPTKPSNPQFIGQDTIFADPTIFTTKAKSIFNLEKNSLVDVKNNSALILESDSIFNISDSAKLIVRKGSTLCIKSGSNLRIEGTGNIIIENGGYLCIEQGANINLVAGASLIKLYEGAHLGVNQSVLGTNNNCISSIDNISITGCGAIIDNVITETTGNETWTTPKTLGEDFTVKSGHTLTIQNTTISLTPRVKIKIEPNAKLIVDNSKLTSYIGVNNCEGDYWGAIEVYGNKNQRQLQQYQGYLELKNNSIIENARNAVSLWKSDDWNSMGGIVNASNTTFKNNIRSVEFVSYQNINQNNEEIDNVSQFVNCTFEWDANMYPHDKTNLNYVTLWNVKGVKFIACDFKNTLTNNNEIPKNGIYSEEAGFGVYGKLIPVTTGFDIERSEFHNLTYGVRAENISNSKNFILQNSYFENNFCGIFTVASNNITIQDNEFRIHPMYKPQEDYPDYAAFGVTVHNCARYKIQRNDFIGENNEEYDYKIGTQIKNSGEGANSIRDNNFINLYQSSQAIGKNRGINNRASTGLKYICNHFEDSKYGIIIKPDNQYRTNGIAINQDGGDITLSAENTFAQNPTLEGSDIFNDNTSGINYYSTQIGNKKPIKITSLVNNCLATDYDGVCSKDYDLLDNTTLDNTFVALENDYISLLYNYNNLLDGGSTDNLLDEIQGSWNGDVWNLREEFLGQSPYLSPKVLKELALSEKLPLPVYLEIALSNPEATQKDEYIDFMKSNEGINVLTTNGIELIKDSWDTKTFRSTVESNISSKLSDMEEIIRVQLYRTINDTTGFNISNYRSLLDNIRNIDAKYELVDSYIGTKEYSNARGLLNSLLTDPEILKYNETDINDYLSLINIMEGRDSTNQMLLNEQLIDLSQSTTRAGSKARAYLNFYDSKTNYNPDYVVISDSTKLAKIKIKRPLNAFEADVTALPNPAKDYIAISYNLKPQTTEYIIKIYDNKGSIVYSGSLKGNKGIQNINTRTFNSGTYVYSVENGNEKCKSSKFIVVR